MTRRSMKVTGFVTIPILGYVAIAALLVISGLGVAVKVQTSRLDALRAEYAQFKGGVEALGLAAKKATAEQEARDKANKEKADAENVHTTATLRADIERLRRDRDGARSRILPQTPGGSKCPDGQACFERAELERALRDYRSAIRGLVDEGSAVTVDLDTAKRWAAKVP